jgi:Peptidase family M41
VHEAHRSMLHALTVHPPVRACPQATNVARAMVCKYGMSESIGKVSLNYEDSSSETRAAVDAEVHLSWDLVPLYIALRISSQFVRSLQMLQTTCQLLPCTLVKRAGEPAAASDGRPA